MWKMRSCGTTISNCNASQKSQNNGVKISKLIWVGKWPLFQMILTSYRSGMIWVEVRSKTNPNLVSKLLPLMTPIAIPLIISYIIELQWLKSELWVVTSHANIHTTRFVQKLLIFSYSLWGHIFWADLREINCSGKLGVKVYRREKWKGQRFFQPYLLDADNLQQYWWVVSNLLYWSLTLRASFNLQPNLTSLRSVLHFQIPQIAKSHPWNKFLLVLLQTPLVRSQGQFGCGHFCATPQLQRFRQQTPQGLRIYICLLKCLWI